MNDNKPISLKAGKFYKTRSGSIAYIAATRCPFKETYTKQVAIGWIDRDEGAELESWTIYGKYCADGNATGLDLVAEHAFECKEDGSACGVDMFTPINREGPYCPSCLERETEAEAQDCGQFGVGA